MNPVAGIDIGGTKIAVGLDGPAAETLVAPTPLGASEILATAARLVREAAGETSLDGVGVGSAGTFDEHGTVAAATDLIPGWIGTPLATRLATELGVPVVAINDVHATALGEATKGGGRGIARVLVAAAGTGLGGAFVRDGTVDTGGHGTSGSVGHVALPGLDRVCSCGVLGHAEPYASGPGIERTFIESGGKAMALPAIGVLARSGDDRARAAIRAGGSVLGEALATAAMLLDPDLIIVGGGAAQLEELLLEPTREAFRRAVATPLAQVTIMPAALGVRAPIVGAHVAIRAELRRRQGGSGGGD